MFYINFSGKSQVMLGIVPVHVKHASSQSATSVYPIVIANCNEDR